LEKMEKHKTLGGMGNGTKIEENGGADDSRGK
jgi:hypothetical protein